MEYVSAMESTRPVDESAVEADARQLRLVMVAGGFLAAAGLTALLWAFLAKPALFVQIVTVVGAMFVGGRIPGILAGFEVGLGTVGTMVVLSAINTTWFCLVYPPLCNVSRRIGSLRFVERLFHRAEEQAVGQVQRVSTLGSWGLPVFVWLPLPLTGAVVGAVLGLLLRMPRFRVFVVVLVSMWVGVVTWTLAFDALFLFTGRAGKIAAWVLTGAFLLYSLYSQRRRRP